MTTAHSRRQPKMGNARAFDANHLLWLSRKRSLAGRFSRAPSKVCLWSGLSQFAASCVPGIPSYFPCKEENNRPSVRTSFRYDFDSGSRFGSTTQDSASVYAVQGFPSSIGWLRAYWFRRVGDAGPVLQWLVSARFAGQDMALQWMNGFDDANGIEGARIINVGTTEGSRSCGCR